VLGLAFQQGGDVALGTRTPAQTTVYVSWNGDTRVTHWIALAGTRATTLTQVAAAARTGFETSIGLSPALTRLQIQGRDATGKPLATTNPTAI
jgi:hypothetical protein